MPAKIVECSLLLAERILKEKSDGVYSLIRIADVFAAREVVINGTTVYPVSLSLFLAIRFAVGDPELDSDQIIELALQDPTGQVVELAKATGAVSKNEDFPDHPRGLTLAARFTVRCKMRGTHYLIARREGASEIARTAFTVTQFLPNEDPDSDE